MGICLLFNLCGFRDKIILRAIFAIFNPYCPPDSKIDDLTNCASKQVCDLPFVFFSDPELMPIIASTLVAASYGCEQNKAVIQQELSMDMLIPSLKSCKSSNQNGVSSDDSAESNQTGPESKKVQADASQRPNRNSTKSTRVLSQKGGASSSNIRSMKMRNQRDSKMLKTCEDMHLGSVQSDTSTFMLHCRFPVSFIDKAEQFFTAEINISNAEST